MSLYLGRDWSLQNLLKTFWTFWCRGRGGLLMRGWHYKLLGSFRPIAERKKNKELVVSVPAWQTQPIQNHVLGGPGLCEIFTKPDDCPKHKRLKKDHDKPNHDRPVTVIWTSRSPERYPMKWEYHESCTDHSHWTFACLENHIQYGKLILQASILEFHVSSPVLNDEHGWSWKSCRSMSQFVISLHKHSPRLLDQGFLRDFFFGHCASSKWWQHFSLLRHCMEFFRLLSFLVGEGWGMTHTSLVDGSAAVLCFSTDQKGKSRTDQINGKKHKTTQ